MEVKVVDFWINTYGGYTIKYSDGSTRSLCKEHLIEVLFGDIVDQLRVFSEVQTDIIDYEPVGQLGIILMKQKE